MKKVDIYTPQYTFTIYIKSNTLTKKDAEQLLIKNIRRGIEFHYDTYG